MYAKWKRVYKEYKMYDEGATCKREVWSRYSKYGQRELFSLQKTPIYEFMISK